MTSSKKLFFSVLALKAAALLAVVAIFGSQKLMWSADALEYADLGQNLAAGHGFSRTAAEGFIPAADRMPLYPFIVGLDSSLVLVSVVQVIAAALISLFTYRVAQRFLPGRWPLAAALIAAFEPLSAVMHMLILPETLLALFILIFIDAFLLYLERGEAKFIFFSALLLLCILYTKPVAMYFLPFPILVLLWRRRQEALLPALILIGVFFAGATPWMLRNAAIGEGFTISTYGQKAMCGYQISAVLASHYGFKETTLGVAMGEIRNLEEYRTRERKCFDDSPFLTLLTLARDYPKDFLKINALAALGYFTNDGYVQIFQNSSALLPPHNNYLTPEVLAVP
ncbi:MAG: glycosyltransferase family 39 protein, partial [Patescibacteria group bacterium]